jgi:EmrB/QacA subfamily drug resistance transporter
VIGVPTLLGPILGPVIGGLILNSVSWRWIFYVNIPIAVVALFMARHWLRADHGRGDAGRLDWLGLALLSPGLAGVVFGLSETETHGGMGATIAWAPIVVGLALVALFVLHALRAPRPLIDVRLFKVTGFSAASATTFMLGGALFGAMIVLPLYYQVARGQSALTAGLLMAPQGVGAAMAMPLAGRLTDRVGGGRVAMVGVVILTLGTIPFAFLTATTPYGLLAALLVVRGIGMGGTMMPSFAAAFATLERPQVPRATSALNAIQRVGGAIGTALLAVVLQHQIVTQLGTGGGGQNALGSIPPAARQRVAAPLATAFANTFWWAVGMAVLAMIPTAILALSQRRARRAESVQPMAEAA